MSQIEVKIPPVGESITTGILARQVNKRQPAASSCGLLELH